MLQDSFMRQFSDVSILGNTLDYLQVNFQFDQDLYSPFMIVAPGMEAPCPPQPACEPCDWRETGCQTPNLNCCGPSFDPAFNTPDNLAMWCLSSSDPNYINFTALEIDQQTSVITIAPGEEAYFRFFLNESTWCSPVRIEIRLHSGEAEAYLSEKSPYPSVTNSILYRTTTYMRNYQSLNMFPWFDGSVGLGTKALKITGRGDVGATFTVQIIVPGEKFPVNPPSDPLSCQYPEAVSTGPVICIQDSVTHYEPIASAGTQLEFVFSLPPGCHTFGVMVYGDFQTYGSDVDLYCGPLDTSQPTYYGNALSSSWDYREDQLTFSTCSDQRIWMKCNAEVWVSGPLSLIFSTQGPVIIKSLTSLDPYDYTTRSGRNAIVLAAPGVPNVLTSSCYDCTIPFSSFQSFFDLFLLTFSFLPPYHQGIRDVTCSGQQRQPLIRSRSGRHRSLFQPILSLGISKESTILRH